MKLKRNQAILLSGLLVMQLLSPVTMAAESKITELYVSVDGNDSNNGSLNAPFKTLEKARDTLRELKKSGSLGEKGAVVYIREGTYSRLESFNLTEEDSGKENAPVTYRAYPGEEVTFVGGVDISLSDFKAVTDESVLERIKYESAKANIKYVSLKDYGLTEIPDMPLYGSYSYAVAEPLTGVKAEAPLELFAGNEPMTIARYPNGNENMYIDQVIEEGTDGFGFTDQARIDRGSGYADDDPIWQNWKGFVIKIDDEHLKNWGEAKDAIIGGRFRRDWAPQSVPIKKVDTEKLTIESGLPAAFLPIPERDCYVYNLIEELDIPGEYYIDKDTGNLYAYLDENAFFADYDSLQLSVLTTPMFNLENASYINIKNLNMEVIRANAVCVKGGSHNNVYGCEISKISTKPIYMNDSYYSGVDSCYVHDVDGSVDIRGGNLETLESSNMYITNCEMENFSRLTGAYTPGLEFHGVGAIITHNELHESVHMAVAWNGNNHLFAYNEIYNVCTDNDDSAAIYAGLHPLTFGNKWIYNYIHDVGGKSSGTLGVHGIYNDDSLAGGYYAGNVFENIKGYGITAAGRDANVTNNIFINIERGAVDFDRRSFGAGEGQGRTLLIELEDYYKNDIWQAAYPDSLDGLEAAIRTGENYQVKNEATGNVLVNTPGVTVDSAIKNGATIENNVSYTSDPGFYDMKNRNYTLKEDSKVYKDLPEFAAIPFTRMGRVDERAEQRASKSIILAIDSPQSLVEGEVRYIDGENKAIVPTIRNSSTFVPIRFISESMGVNIEWNDAERTVNIADGKIIINVDSGEFTKDGVKVEGIENKPFIENGRTYLPLRAVAELLDKEVFWEDRGFISISNTEELFNSERDSDIISYLYNEISVQ